MAWVSSSDANPHLGQTGSTPTQQSATLEAGHMFPATEDSKAAIFEYSELDEFKMTGVLYVDSCLGIRDGPCGMKKLIKVIYCLFTL